ncbi:hypothetical protein [Simkania sp.]|uniref:hypothetical protein n=1 Tax=Simkania sp. TaxID=34094 RepID=UPI003B527E25
MTFTCDDIQFQENGTLYEPLSDEKLKTLSIDLSLASDLDFSKVQEEAETAEKILWNLDFDLASVSFYDKTTLASFLVAIKSFNEELLLPFLDKTFGVCLYQGPLLIPFKWNLEHEEGFTDWQESYQKFPDPKNLYCVEIFSEYLHRLAAALSDEAMPMALFVPFEGSNARLAQFLSKEHFPYLYVGLKGHSLPIGPFSSEAAHARVGITLPLHTHCSKESLAAMDRCMEELQQQKVPFRIVSEAHLTESWDGLDSLVIFSDFLSNQGKRKAQGFVAAGGEIVTVGSSLEMPIEISWEEFRGRGI